LNACTDDQCFCTATNIKNFAACLQCTANLVGDAEELQSTLNGKSANISRSFTLPHYLSPEVIQDCDTEGFNVPNETLTGGTGGNVPTSNTLGGSTPTLTNPGESNPTGSFSFASPQPTSPAVPTNGVSVTVVPTTTSGSGNGIPKLGGSSNKALGMGVPQTFIATFVGGVFIALTAL
jgi:hypothetical protein